MARAAGPERRLLAVYTGGTLGMRSERGVLVPGAGLATVLRALPMFHDEEYARTRGLPEDTLVLPAWVGSEGHLHFPSEAAARTAAPVYLPASPDQRVIYTVLECQPLFDSSDMTIVEWVQIAQTIERHYEQYDGFVVIHGTDTMAFAASVLSFVLENLQKAVILTGAQGQWRLRGPDLLVQGSPPTAAHLTRSRASAHPRPVERWPREPAGGPAHGCPEPDPRVNQELVRRVRRKDQLLVHSNMEQDVGLLRLYPGIPASLVRAFLQPPLKGVVMETFGSGNGPTKPELLQELQVAARRGLVIINCTHCLQGTVTSDYAASRAMVGAGIVSGFDMTSEAALAKLSYVLGQPGLSLDSRKELLARDLRGEMTLPTVDMCQPLLQHSLLSRGVTQLLSLSQEAHAVRDALMPSLACAVARAGDMEALQVLVELGSDLSREDFNGQTPLHAAARGGHPGAVTMLLRRGADVNAQDEDGLSPLLLAVRGRHQRVIGLLRAAGACLSPQELEDTGTELCRLASRVDLEGLRVWWQAGADLGQPGYDGRSALLVAEAAGNLEVVSLLQSLQRGPGAQAPSPDVLPGV
ncbi:60 kDa lysophospholipase isoform X3 [Manis javanica]|uniref:60 kDa lysophospholipase isoform X3 n=1 Tax=Manis javanica TaxID=9974 RepID=UPI003C6CCF62